MKLQARQLTLPAHVYRFCYEGVLRLSVVNPSAVSLLDGNNPASSLASGQRRPSVRHQLHVGAFANGLGGLQVD
jgi:hypothetical protein